MWRDACGGWEGFTQAFAFAFIGILSTTTVTTVFAGFSVVPDLAKNTFAAGIY